MKWKITAVLIATAALLWSGNGVVRSQAPGDETADTLFKFYDSLYAHELPPDTFNNLLPEYVGFGEG